MANYELFESDKEVIEDALWHFKKKNFGKWKPREVVEYIEKEFWPGQIGTEEKRAAYLEYLEGLIEEKFDGLYDLKKNAKKSIYDFINKIQKLDGVFAESYNDLRKLFEAIEIIEKLSENEMDKYFEIMEV